MSNWTKTKRLNVFNKCKGSCAYCGTEISKFNFHIDHVVPKQRGYNRDEKERLGIVFGENNIENLLPCCKSCNSSKSTYPLEVWRDELSKTLDRLERDNSQYRKAKRFGMIQELDNPIVFRYEKLNIKLNG